jgi:hypothetical protein
VRRGDDDAEIEREQCDRRRRQHACEHRVAACRDDTAGERVLQLDAGRARVAADEYATAPGPERGCAGEAFDEVGRDSVADDPTDTVRAEVPAGHSAGG